jgi:hypothetical protein
MLWRWYGETAKEQPFNEIGVVVIGRKRPGRCKDSQIYQKSKPEK